MKRRQVRRADATITERLLAHADEHPEKTLFTFSDHKGGLSASYSYAEFIQRTEDVAAHLLQESAAAPGDRVLLVYPPGLEMLSAFFACVRLGWVPVPVPPPAGQGFQASLERMDGIADDCGASAVLTDRTYLWSMKLRRVKLRLERPFRARGRTARLPWIATDDAVPGVAADLPEACSQILFLQYTSGSTREPRGVMVTHRNVLANCATVFDAPPVGVSWLPQYHDMGLIGSCLFVAASGGTCHLSSPLDFLRRPVSWLEAMTRNAATVSAAPSFAYELCLRQDKVPDGSLRDVDLSSLEVLLNGAEPVRADVFQAFQERFAPYGLRPGTLRAAYGLAEYTLAVSNRGSVVRSFDADGLADGRVVPVPHMDRSRSTRLVGCGPPLGATEARIVDVSDRPEEAAPGAIGEIWVDGPSKCLGYWNQPELTEKTFNARLGDGERRWLRTGDLGFVHDGEIHVCGRLKDLIIVRGLNYYPQDIEALVGEHHAVRKGCVAAFAVDRGGIETLVVVAEVRGDPPEDVDEINRALRRGLGIVARHFTFIRKRTLPKTSSGKVRRGEARARWLDHRLDVVAHVEGSDPGNPSSPEAVGPGADMTPADEWGTEASVARTFRQRGLQGTEDLTLGQLGLDSLGLVDLACEVEKHLEAAGAADGLVDAVDLRWLQRISVADLVGLLQRVVRSDPGAELSFCRALAELRAEHQELEWHMMRRDAQMAVPGLSDGIGRNRAGVDGRGVLLTGGTGFFGPFLLRSLLEQTHDPIYVLIRASHEAHAMDRLADALDSLGPRLRTGALERWRQRVTPVCGDLARPALGLAPEDWSLLAHRTHAVYHNGASVNYLLDYADCRAANVLGTRELLRLATQGRVKAVNHVSTTFVFGWSTKQRLLEGDISDDLSLLDFGYSQSKWVAERMVSKAMAEGLPGRIFRPALIAPSMCGGGGGFDIAMRLLTFMLDHGLGTSAGNQVSLSPADLVADNIVAISGLPDTVGETFHVTRDQRSTMRDVTELLRKRTGTEFEYFPLDDFVPEVVARCGPGDLLFPLLNFLVRSSDRISAMEFKEYDSRSYRRARARAPHAREDPPLEDVVDGILRFLRRQGVLHEAASEAAGAPPQEELAC